MYHTFEAIASTNATVTRGIAPDFWHKEDWKDGRREGWKFSVHAYLKPDGYIKPAGFPNSMAAVLGFTTISGAFSGSGVRAAVILWTGRS